MEMKKDRRVTFPAWEKLRFALLALALVLLWNGTSLPALRTPQDATSLSDASLPCGAPSNR